MLVLIISTIRTTAQSKISSDYINTAAHKVVDWRHDIHQNPDLGNREVRTTELVADYLNALGIEVKTKVGITGVVGILKGRKPGPVIAMPADIMLIDGSSVCPKDSGLLRRKLKPR